LQTVRPTRSNDQQEIVTSLNTTDLDLRANRQDLAVNNSTRTRSQSRQRSILYISVAGLFAASTVAFPLVAAVAQQQAPATAQATTAGSPAVATVAPAAQPSVNVSVVDGIKPAQTVSTSGKTVQDALTTAHIALGAEDTLTPALTSGITSNTRIVITRVRTVTETETTSIPFKTVFRLSADLKPGSIGHGHHGAPGILVKTFTAKYINDKLVSRPLLEKHIAKQPVDEETLGGIRTRMAAALPSRSGSYRRMRSLNMVATGYSPHEGSSTGRCATGMRAGYGVVAVDPRVIRLHSRLYIEGYGYAIAGDTGGAIKGRRIDLGHSTYREALHVGRRNVKVWVLDSGQ